MATVCLLPCIGPGRGPIGGHMTTPTPDLCLDGLETAYFLDAICSGALSGAAIWMALKLHSS